MNLTGSITCLKKKNKTEESTCKYTCESFKSSLDFDSFQLTVKDETC